MFSQGFKFVGNVGYLVTHGCSLNALILQRREGEEEGSIFDLSLLESSAPLTPKLLTCDVSYASPIATFCYGSRIDRASEKKM